LPVVNADLPVANADLPVVNPDLPVSARPAITLLLMVLVVASKLAVGLAAGLLENSDFFSIAMIRFPPQNFDCVPAPY
jgi:hypothetical protein